MQDAIDGISYPGRPGRRNAAAVARRSRTRTLEEVALPTPLHPVPLGRARRPAAVVRLALAARHRSPSHWTHPEVTD